MKKPLVLLLCIVMLAALLAGCGTNNVTSPTPTAKASTPIPSAKADAPPEDTGPDLSQEMVLPLSDEKINMDIFYAYRGTSTNYFTDMNDMKICQYIEEITNVHMDYILPATTNIAESLNLVYASGDYPDIFWLHQTPYTGGGDKAIEDGVFLRLNDLIDEYAPNYKAVREWSDTHRKMTITDYGNIWGMAHVTKTTEPPWTGLGIRQDWLDKLGMSIPVTLDDWYVTLQAFRDDIGAPGPLYIPYNGMFYSGEFMSAFGIGKAFYQEDGVAKYSYIEPEFKDYLELMNKWYNEGLIYKDFTSLDYISVLYPADSFLEEDVCGAMPIMWGLSADVKVKSGVVTNPDFWLSAVNVPRMNADTPTGYAFSETPVRGFATISTQCKRPDIAIRWMDWRYSEEGAITTQYGIEGVSYDMVDGKPQYKDFMLETDPESRGDRETYKLGGDRFGWLLYDAMYVTANPDALKAYDVWSADSTDKRMPSITMTADEANEYAKIIGDVDTYVAENVVRFITGMQSLDQFDGFVAQLKTLGIEKIITIQQAGLDRYNSR